MSRQLILFAGLHKTGSTSIQKTCVRSRNAILRAGFLYPEVLIKGRRFDNLTAALHFMFRKEPHKAGLLSVFASQHIFRLRRKIING